MHRRAKGNKGEKIALQYYLDRDYQYVKANYTIWGGEIDLIVENSDTTVFIEVKVVDHIDDLFGYITEKKLYFIRKTIDHYIYEHSTKSQVRIDVVFVKNDAIWEVYENIGGE